MVEITDYDGDGVKFEDARGNSIAAERAKIVQRNAQGAVEFEQEGSSQITGVTQTGVTNTASITGATGKVNYDKLKLGINGGTADLTAKRNGNNVISKTGVTAGQTVTFTGSPRTSSPDWTINNKWNSFKQKVDSEQELSSAYVATLSYTFTLEGNGTSIVAEAHVADTYSNGLTIKVNNNTIASNTGSSTLTVSGNTNGSFTSPSITIVRIGNGLQEVDGITATLYGQVEAVTATLTASRNKVTTVG